MADQNLADFSARRMNKQFQDFELCDQSLKSPVGALYVQITLKVQRLMVLKYQGPVTINHSPESHSNPLEALYSSTEGVQAWAPAQLKPSPYHDVHFMFSASHPTGATI